MCPLNALILMFIAFLVPALIYLHISISLGQRQGDLSGTYRPTPLERIFDIIFLLVVIMLGVVFVNIDDSVKTPASMSVTHIIVFSIFIGAFLFLVFLRYRQTQSQIRQWLAEQGYQAQSFHWCVFDNPWARDSSGIYPSQFKFQFFH